MYVDSDSDDDAEYNNHALGIKKRNQNSSATDPKNAPPSNHSSNALPLEYNIVPLVKRPPRLKPIAPNPVLLREKEALRLLCGQFAWDRYLNGEIKPKCTFDAAFLENCKTKKRELSWKCSVTRQAALTIQEATIAKDSHQVYESFQVRRSVMDAARHKEQLRRRQGGGGGSSHQRSATAPPPSSTLVDEEDDNSKVNSSSQIFAPTGHLPPLHKERLTHLLLLNDEMLARELRESLPQGQQASWFVQGALQSRSVSQLLKKTSNKM